MLVLPQSGEQHPSKAGSIPVRRACRCSSPWRLCGRQDPAVPLGLRVAARGREGKEAEKREVGEWGASTMWIDFRQLKEKRMKYRAECQSEPFLPSSPPKLLLCQ